jgi:hypothetical protein
MQVLSIIPVLFYYWAKSEDALETSRFFNDYIAEIVSRYPERFIGIGTVPLQALISLSKKCNGASMNLEWLVLKSDRMLIHGISAILL